MLIPHEGSTNIHINSHGLEVQDSLLPPPQTDLTMIFCNQEICFYWEKFGVFFFFFCQKGWTFCISSLKIG